MLVEGQVFICEVLGQRVTTAGKLPGKALLLLLLRSLVFVIPTASKY